MNAVVVVITVASLMLMCQLTFAESGVVPAADQTHQQATDRSSVNRAAKYPIKVLPASEVLSHYKEAIRAMPPAPPKEPETETPEQRLLRQLVGTGAAIELPRPQCFRAIPTRDEFLNMVRENSADASQLIQRCRLDLRSISPLPQLPVGNRQLPVDTRQRAVGTWNN
jgi:hypothetical protein